MHNRIKELRKYLGLTQEEFGSRVGITKSAVSMIEKENGNAPSKPTIKMICSVFNVSETWLEQGIGPMMIEPDSVEEEVADKIRNANPWAKAFSMMVLSRSYEELVVMEKAFEDLTAIYEKLKKEGE